MNLPTVVYIDDNPRDARLVQAALKKQLKVIFVKPQAALDALLLEAFAHKPEAIIVDFRLADVAGDVRYDGYTVLSAILEHRLKYPVFILTSNENDAFVEVDDVNYVYEKSQIHNSAAFAARVVRQIAKYQDKLAESESRILELLAKSRNPAEKLTIEEEQELIELDSFIEKSLDKQSAVPTELKKLSNEQRVSDILREVDGFLHDMKKKLPGYE